MSSICQTAGCENKVSTIGWSEGDAPRHYCEKCYLEDQEEDECEEVSYYPVLLDVDRRKQENKSIYQLAEDYNRVHAQWKNTEIETDRWDDLNEERSIIASDLRCAIWDLPPPRQDLLDDQFAYQHELFKQVMTIRQAQKTIGREIDRVFAHPCAKMIDRVITQFWRDCHLQNGMNVIKQCCGEDEYKAMLFNRLPILSNWAIKVAQHNPYLFTKYISDWASNEDYWTDFAGFPNRLIGNPSDAHYRRVCDRVTETKTGKVVKARAERLYKMIVKGEHNGSYDGFKFNPDMCIKMFRENKYQSPVKRDPRIYFRKNVLGLHWRGVRRDLNEPHWNSQFLPYPDEYWYAELEYMDDLNCWGRQQVEFKRK